MVDADLPHAEARRYADERGQAGADFDRRMLRWNDIVAVGQFYAAVGENQPSCAIGGVRDAVDACVRGDPMHVSKSGPLAIIEANRWMLPEGGE